MWVRGNATGRGISYRHAALTGTGAALALNGGERRDRVIGNLDGGGGVVGTVDVMAWAPLVMLLAVNAVRCLAAGRHHCQRSLAVPHGRVSAEGV